MTDASNFPIEVGNPVQVRPWVGSDTPEGEAVVARLDPENWLVFVIFDGETEEFGCLPVELIVIVPA